MLSKVFTGSSYFFNMIFDNDKINQSVVHLCTKFATSKLMRKIKFEFFKLPCSSNNIFLAIIILLGTVNQLLFATTLFHNLLP